MDVSTLQPIGLAAVVGAMIITLYEMGAALRPVTCPECPHCRAIAEADRREQERLASDYTRRAGLSDKDDSDDRKIG